MHTLTGSLLAFILSLQALFVTPAQNIEAEQHCQVIYLGVRVTTATALIQFL